MTTARHSHARAACITALAALAASCAVFGPPRVTGSCDERFESLRPVVEAGGGLELVGKMRLDFPPYRLRGLVRIAYSPSERAARLDFRQSSLFGAVEEDVTVFVGDSLGILDRESGRYFGNDSSLALVERGAGERIEAADILAALLFAVPRCAEVEGAAVEYRGDSWELRGLWRGREIDMRGVQEEGVREMRECFSGEKGCFTAKYGPPMIKGNLRYPRWVSVSRENGAERATLEFTDIKQVSDSTSIFDGSGSTAP